MEIVLATHNLHKIREFRDMLKPFKHIEVLSLLNFPHYILPKEEGKTLAENAAAKAQDAAAVLNMIVLADDSGLIVPALNGEPGIYSARYDGEEASEAENRKKLLGKMEGFSDIDRYAFFECCLALASPEGLIKTVTGTCEGYILHEERGRNGFGYDALFVKHEYDKTFAEIEEATKNRISHRRKAIEKLTATLETL
jgi:XTP/dITP diphosphohydrolase